MHWLVVGAGTAGCVVAARLAAGSDHRVTVIERGADLSGPTTPPAIRSIDYTAALATERNARDTYARRTAAGATIAYPLGRGVGGSSVVNGMVMERGDPSQYARWGWTDAAEAFERVQVPARRVTGDELGPIDRALEAATSTARHVELSADATGRVTVVDAYLDTVRDQANVTVMADRPVTSLRAAGDRVTGVELAGGAGIEADAVVLCAGALGTPVVLLRSALEVPRVGIGLTDHPSATVNVRLHDPQPDASTLVTTGLIAGDDRVQVTAMSHVGVAPGEQALGAVTVALLRPRSRGRLTMSTDGSPSIELMQYSDPEDHAEMIGAVETLRDRVADLGHLVDEVTIDDHGTPIATLDSRDAIAAWLTNCTGTYVHPAASCPMGPVVDDDGRVHGISNLFVVDASVFPEIPAAPTYLPTLMLAERLAPRLRHWSDG
jgi:choline dehydrogenase-like flavoprotein